MAKAKPGELNYASGVSGSSNHIATELFKAMMVIKMVRVPYSGTGPALNAVNAGEVRVIFPGAGAAIAHIKSGRLRALALGSAEPSPLLPGMPTVAASGLPGFAYESRQGMWAPGKTPAALIKQLNQEIVRVLKLPETIDQFRNAATETVGSTPEAFAAAIKSEMASLGKVIRDAGIRGE